MQQVLDRLLTKIQSADIDPLPSDNIFMEEVFDPKLYAEILQRLPDDSIYKFIDHPDAILPDGRRTRKVLDLTDAPLQDFNPADLDFWRDMQAIMSANVLLDAIVKKFETRLHLRFGTTIPEMLLVPLFYRDYPGYYITEHTDVPYKIATLQFYLPRDHSQVHLGTSFHLKKLTGFQLLKTNRFQPNSAYAFIRTDESWHSVKQLGADEQIRDTIALTVYVKGQEYNSKTY